MSMLTIFEDVRRSLPFDLETVSIKEDRTKYRLTVKYGEIKTSIDLRKMVEPGEEESYCWYAIATAMSSIYLLCGNAAKGRLWLDAMHDRGLISAANY